MCEGFPTATGKNGQSRNLMVAIWLSIANQHAAPSEGNNELDGNNGSVDVIAI
jgi:hypothetical protein